MVIFVMARKRRERKQETKKEDADGKRKKAVGST